MKLITAKFIVEYSERQVRRIPIQCIRIIEASIAGTGKEFLMDNCIKYSKSI